MKLRNLTLSVFAILAVCCVPIAAGEVETVTEKIDSEGAEVLDIRCEFGAGEFVIQPKDIKDAAELEVTYTPRGHKGRSRAGGDIYSTMGNL